MTDDYARLILARLIRKLADVRVVSPDLGPDGNPTDTALFYRESPDDRVLLDWANGVMAPVSSLDGTRD